MKKWSALILLSMAAFIMVIDSTAMNVSISNLVADLNTDLGTIQFIMSFYTLIMAVFMLPGAKIADMYGAKKIFKYGVMLYGVGTLTAAFSVNTTMLFIGWAIIEGLASSLMMPTALSLITSAYQGRDRAVAMSIYTAMASVALAIGPIFGGMITTYLSWRYVFAIEVLIVVAILVFIKQLEAVKCEDADKSAKFDLIGTALLTVSLVSIIQGGLMSKTHGWFVAGLMLCVGLVVLAVFAFWLSYAKQRGKPVLVDIDIFKSRKFNCVLIVNLLVQMSLMATMFVVPIYLQNVQKYNALSTGFTILPLSIVLFVTALLIVKVTSKFPVHLVIAFGAFVMLAGGFYMVYTFNTTEAVDGTQIAPAMILLGIGIACTLSLTGNLGLSSLESRHSNQGSGTITTISNLGSSLSTAVMGSLLISGIFSGIAKTLISIKPEALSEYSIPELTKAIETAVGKMQGADLRSISLTAEQTENIKTVLIGGMNQSMITIFYVTMGISALACVISLLFLKSESSVK